jgi:small conductance mechanosensitive channel
MDSFQLTLDWANRNVASIVWGIISAILILVIGRWLAKVITRYATRSMERAKLDPLVNRFVQTLIFWGLMGAVVIVALSQVGVHTSSLTAVLASIGLAFGLAIKDSLSNLASGVMIMLYKPYSINHYVDAGGTSGSVEEVQIFSTILRTPDNVKVIVPNSAILNKNIKNYSAFDNRRIDLVVSIPYEDNIGAVRNLLMEITASHPLVLSEPAPTVEVQELAASSVNLAVHPWVRTENYEQVRSDLLEQIKLRVK